ncbi:TonB-linked SusC/RagA family outer membrane protein [Arcticibacter pallidicorallinus]|uniref:TonB-linked SusC/RagA family outer membrane protein n=1 Tax=Arcticibacter pallidicorallinus TaxID=1259464 RepID=A0A2T0UC90_9SPHI|nr:SusC/RagA family TonB-linked outer membrane protein [Arcticibacter pallidicorallinus]PRY55529.1 TonB-linked SusC/RagA family outer membrane protein [Arcticibacter pallidicorallinus]
MKYSRIAWAIYLFVMLSVGVANAQDAAKIAVKAIVRGVGGEPLSGAVITNESLKLKTVTDSRGMLEVSVPEEAILTVSADGYKTSSIVVTADLDRIDLAQDIYSVNVAFKSANAKDLPSGVSSVNISELLEKNYLINYDGLEAFAPGYNGNQLWGMNSSLVLIDGVPRDISSISPNEVDHITFLKSASAVALYGSRGAKGVIMVSTKRGTDSNQRINVRANAGINAPKGYPQYLGSSEYMTLYNEARLNDGLGVLYSDEAIYNHSAGNPYRYPNVDYYSSDYIKNSYARYDAVTEISGGNERARYYTNLGMSSNGSLLNFGEAKDHNTTQRFNVRGNVDMKLNRILKARIDASAVFANGSGVNTDYFGSAATLRPNRFTPLIPLSYLEENDEANWAIVNAATIIDNKYVLGGTSLDQTNPFAAIYAGGSNKFVQREFQFTTGVDADLNGLMDGLSFSTTMGVDYWNRYNQGYRNGYATYQPTWTSYSGTDLLSGLQIFGQDTRSGQEVIADSWYRQTISLSAQLNYNKTVNGSHNISAILMGAAFRQSLSEVYQPTTNSNIGLQLGYNFNQKYFAELTGAVVRSPKLASGNRTAFSPAGSIGWRLSEEPFLKDVSFIDNLKLTASAGILHTDIDITDYFLYESIYTGTGNWYGWNDGSGTQSTDSRRGENFDLKMARREEVSLGIDGILFKNQLSFGANVFRNTLSGNAIQASALYPNYFTQNFPSSSFIPYVNYNNDQRTGLDFYLNVNKRIGAVNWILGTALTYYTTKATKRAEIFQDAYQNRSGRPLDAIWGLQSDGFYMDAAEVAAADGVNGAKPAFGAIAPGDIRYKDQNGDNVINERDEVYLGRGGWSGSPLTVGVNLSATWKNLTFFALATGRFGAYAMKSNSYFWVNGDDKYSAVVRDRWTEETKNTATFPRLTTLGGDNNFRNSDFWMYSTDRIDLSKVQISYKISDNVLKSKFLHELGIYVAGYNLLTGAKEREILETNFGAAPQTRLYNLGVKALF